jgi:oligopeptide transport system permease protein
MKGLNEVRIMTVHVWKNAIIPVLAYLGPVITNILVGSFVVERIFGIPGLGQWFVTAVINRDYPVIGGLTLFYSVFLLINHTAIDLLSAFLNPAAKIVSQPPKLVESSS